MRSGKSTCKLLVALMLLSVPVGCTFLRREPPIEVTSVPVATQTKGQHDPLGLAQDTIVITQGEPHADGTPLSGGSRVDAIPSPSEGNSRISGETLSDSASATSQVFRVQLLTLNTYGEGRRALSVAQEMFDQPVSLDYDLPYYKVRVGQFATRAGAEKYLQRARTAGYPNALVVIATVGVKEVPSLYDPTGSHQGHPPDKSADSTRSGQN